METNDSILNVVKSCDDVILATVCENGYPDARHLTNAMNRFATDLNLYFLTGIDTPKYKELSQQSQCCLYYFNPTTRHAVRLYGAMEFITDKNTRHKLWHNDFKRFGYTGPDDANFVLMQFMPAQYKYYIGDKMHAGKNNPCVKDLYII